METLFIMLVTGAICIVSFFVGAWVGSRAKNGAVIEMHQIDPTKPIREHKERKIAKAENDALATILRNIDNYDGTAQGQEDIPRR